MRIAKRAGFLVLVCLSAALLGGCKSDASFSDKEMQQFKEGPPAQPPPEAIQKMREGMQQPAPAGPPPAAAPGGGK